MTKALKANFTLDKRFKARWLAALRSGKFAQTRLQLYRTSDNGFCCLGVMCRLKGATLSQLAKEGFPQELENFEQLFGLTDLTVAQQKAVEAWGDTGVADAWLVPYKGRLRPLNELNDDEHLSFKQIACIIERSVNTH